MKSQDDENESTTTDALIDNTNALLAKVGIGARISTIEEFKRVASSVFVAIYESIYRQRIEEVIRSPTSKEEFERNAQLVLNNLSEVTNMNLSHITGQSIVEGDVLHLSYLVHIFTRIVSLNSQGSVGNLGSIDDENELFNGQTFNKRTMQSSFDSISTKDSLLMPKDQSQKSAPSTPKSSKERLLNKHLEEAKVKAEKILRHESSLQQAKLRRNLRRCWQDSQTMMKNKQKQEISARAMHRRHIRDMANEELSYKKKSENDRVVALRKIHQGLYKEILRLKDEQRKQDKLRIEEEKRQLSEHFEMLQSLLRDRVEDMTLRSSKSENMADEDLQHTRKLIQDIFQHQSNIVEEYRNSYRQNLEHERNRKREGYNDLLSLIQVESWSDSLRNYPNSHSPSPSKQNKAKKLPKRSFSR